MENLFLNLLNISITASWIVLAVLLLRIALKKAPKWVFCLLWAIVGLRLIMPFSMESVFSLLPEKETVNAGSYQVQTGVDVIDDAFNEYFGDFSYVLPESNEADAPDNVATGTPAVNVQTPTLSVEPVSVITGIWIAGMVLMIVYSAISWLVLRRKVREGIPYEDNIYVCDHVDSAFILGIFRPRIYLFSDLPEEQMGYVICHEKAHLHRYDHLWKPLGFVLLTVHWFNPIMWLAYILLCRDIELACDEKAIQNMNLEDKQGYAEALMACSVQRRMVTACPVAFGEVGIKKRVKSVVNYRKPAFWMIITAIVACIVTAVCFLTDPVKGYTCQEVERAYEALQAEKDKNGMTKQDEYLAYAELYRMIAQGTRRETEQFEELIIKITDRPFEFQNDQVFNLVESYAVLLTEKAVKHTPDNYAMWVGDISDSQVGLKFDYSGEIHYSVKMVEIGELWSNNSLVPYYGEYGNYLMEISFEDISAGGSVAGRYSMGSVHYGGNTYIGASRCYDLHVGVMGRDGGTDVIYVGSNCPFSVEEQTGVVANGPSGSVSIILDFTEYTQMYSGIVLGEPVIFPNAPGKGTVCALPETYGISDLVWPRWQRQFRFCDLKNTEFYISIPCIYPFSEDAVACQREIYELIKSQAEWPLELLAEHNNTAMLLDKREDIFFNQDPNRRYYSYQAGCYNDVLSIVIRTNGADVPWSNYYVYYLDLTTGKRLTAEEANAKYAVDKEEIKSAMEKYYRQMHESVDEKMDDYQDNLKKTVNDENIDDCQIFYTEEGKLMIIANIYTLDAVNITQQMVELLA